jgi:dihydrodipicolinate synthase/N-acetylneuraminate lyase
MSQKILAINEIYVKILFKAEGVRNMEGKSTIIAVSGKGGVAAVKYAMDLAGLAGGEPRLPLLPLDDETKNNIRAKLEAEGLI